VHTSDGAVEKQATQQRYTKNMILAYVNGHAHSLLCKLAQTSAYSGTAKMFSVAFLSTRCKTNAAVFNLLLHWPL
jgi:hypothetical protein